MPVPVCAVGCRARDAEVGQLDDIVAGPDAPARWHGFRSRCTTPWRCAWASAKRHALLARAQHHGRSGSRRSVAGVAGVEVAAGHQLHGQPGQAAFDAGVPCTATMSGCTRRCAIARSFARKPSRARLKASAGRRPAQGGQLESATGGPAAPIGQIDLAAVHPRPSRALQRKPATVCRGASLRDPASGPGCQAAAAGGALCASPSSPMANTSSAPATPAP